MFPTIHIAYRTTEGRYETVVCGMEDPGIYFANEFVQDWVLKHLPSGASLFLVTINGSPKTVPLFS